MQGDADAIDPAATAPETTSDRAPGPGSRIGRFTLDALLGTGGMGIVFAANDPVLDRRLAIKLLRGGSENAEARLLREAQAMARLAHPNVVTVYEAGVVGDRVYIAMELIDGTNLRDWLVEPHGWRQVVATFLAAGRGLVAAHEAGLVHRDFKPANVLLDRRGVVKVSDFGIVGVAGQEGALGTGSGSALDRPLTETGAVLGTPAYMAPEQATGGVIDARADQYAYCKAFLEALGERAPRRVRAALERGLEQVPAARYPTMTGLLVDLDRAVRGRRGGWLAVAGVTVAASAIAIGATWMATGGVEDPCPRLGTLDGVWDAPRLERLRSHLVAKDPVQGAARFAAARGALGAYADTWREMIVEACRANQDGAESDTLYERRARCLDRRRAQLRGAVAALESAADPAAIDRAVAASQGLTPLAGCADSEALLAAMPPPEDPDTRRAVDAVMAELAAIDGFPDAGRHRDADRRSVAAVAQARATNHLPAISAALRHRAELLFGLESVDSSSTLRELIEVAARARDDLTAAWASSELVNVVATMGARPEEALAIVPAARAALLRAGDPWDARVTFHYNHAAALQAAARFPQALAELDLAEKLLIEHGAELPGSPVARRLADVLYLRGTIRRRAGEYVAAEAPLRKAIELWHYAYGPDHVDAAWAWNELAEVYRLQRKADDAIAAYREATRIRELRLGESSVLALTLVNFGYQLSQLGKADEAVAMLERAVRIHRREGGRGLAMATATLGTVYSSLKRSADARRAFDEAIAQLEKLGGADPNHPIALVNRADLAVAEGHCDRALADYTQAHELFVKYVGPAHPYVAHPLAARGRCLVVLHRHPEALADLEAVLAMTGEVDRLVIAQARLYRARALFESGRDRRGGLAAARSVRAELAGLAGLAAMPDAKQLLDEADAWLRAR